MKYKKRNDPDFWWMARSFLHDYMTVIRNLSDKSVNAYKQSLYSYLDFLKESLGIEKPNVTFECFNRNSIKKYISWMKDEKKYSVKTINLRITAIKSFLKYCAEEDIELYAFYTEAYSIKGLKEGKKPIIYLSDKAIKELLAVIGTDTQKRRRNRMLLILMYDSAARVQELSDLTLADLHIDTQQPFITLTGKGRKSRNVPLMDKTIKHLKVYLQEFHTNVENHPLFYCLHDGRPHQLSTDSISLILKNTAEAARKRCPDIPKPIHCHLIRKTRAMDLYKQGIPLPIIMQILGHESMSTTSTFYAFATVDMMYDAMKKANPSAIVDIPNWKDKKILQALYSLD